MLGKAEHAPQVPLSWTEIAGHRIQMVGDIEGPGQYAMRGDPREGPAMLFRITGGRLAATVAVDAPRDFAMATRLVELDAQVSTELLCERSVELRELYRAARDEAILT